MKQKFKIIISLSLIIISVILGFVTYSLLTDTDTKGPFTYEFGHLEFSVDGSIKENYLYPGENIITQNYMLSNHSTIDTEVRLSFKFYMADLELTLAEFLDYIEEDGFGLDETSWLYDDGFYYYKDTITPEDDLILILNKIIFDGHVVRNNFRSEDFKIELTIHAKQEKHATWEDLGSKFID